MEDHRVEAALERAERQLDEGQGLSGSGFWGAVSAVKSDPVLVERYASRIAAIDDRAFRRWALLVIPQALGTAMAVLATAIGVFLVGLAYRLDDWPAVIAFFAGVGILLVTTHGLAHLIVGRLVGIRFTSWFIGTLLRPQPGVKIDYETYLRARPKGRAWMHASGAITTKVIPFAMIGAALAADLPGWTVWALAVLGAATVLTDILWSTEKSDWKRFKREMEFAQRA
jgi:hypothetical protein